jgi:hypothetical protein
LLPRRMRMANRRIKVGSENSSGDDVSSRSQLTCISK